MLRNTLFKIAAAAVAIGFLTSLAPAQITPVVPSGCMLLNYPMTTPRARIGEVFGVRCCECTEQLGPNTQAPVVFIGLSRQEPIIIPEDLSCAPSECLIVCDFVAKFASPWRVTIPDDPGLIGGCFCIQCEYWDDDEGCFWFSSAVEVCIEGPVEPTVRPIDPV